MPNLDSTGKQGRSMDCSQLLDFKKKYKTVQTQNGKNPPGDQSQKPKFNSDRMGGGGSENGASWYYNQRGNNLIFQRFFGIGGGYSIDSRLSEYVAFVNSIPGGVRVLSYRILSVSSTEMTITSTQTRGGVTETVIGTLPVEIVTSNSFDFTVGSSEPLILNNSGGTIQVTMTGGSIVYYSNGQYFGDLPNN